MHKLFTLGKVGTEFHRSIRAVEIFNTLICRFKETIAAFRRTDDIQVDKLINDLFLGHKLAEKDAEFLF